MGGKIFLVIDVAHIVIVPPLALELKLCILGHSQRKFETGLRVQCGAKLINRAGSEEVNQQAVGAGIGWKVKHFHAHFDI